MMSPQDREYFHTGIFSLMVSIALNGAGLLAVDHAYTGRSFSAHGPSKKAHKALVKKEAEIEVEFIEAPPRPKMDRQKRTRKIAAFDAVSSDATADKSKSEELPKIAVKGLSDQLAQIKNEKGSSFSPAVAPVPERPASARSAPQLAPEKTVASEPPRAQGSGDKDAMPDPAAATVSQSVSQEPAQRPRAGAEPSQQVIGLSGQDRITTQATARTMSQGAKEFGVTSFEATGSGMGVYMKNLKEKVWLAWFPYLAYHYPRDFYGADAVISFTLDASGEVKIVKVAEYHGSPAFAEYCVNVIQRASNFGKVPDEILALTGKDTLEIKFGFHYG